MRIGTSLVNTIGRGLMLITKLVFDLVSWLVQNLATEKGYLATSLTFRNDSTKIEA